MILAPVRLPPLPQPIPYQGSKRRLAAVILSLVPGRRSIRLYESFAGSAAITLAAAHLGLAGRFVPSDPLVPLIDSWRGVVRSPQRLAAAYEQPWTAHLSAPQLVYRRVRDEVTAEGDAAKLLYPLARCVTNAPRFNVWVGGAARGGPRCCSRPVMIVSGTGPKMS